MAKKSSPKALLGAPTVELISPTGLTNVAKGSTVTAVFKVTTAGGPFTVKADRIEVTTMGSTTVSICNPCAPIAPGSAYYHITTTLPNGSRQYTIRLTATETSSGDSSSADANYWTGP